LTIAGFLFILLTRAEVVELVDALRSGRSGSNPVGVRVPPSAPYCEIPNLNNRQPSFYRHSRMLLPGIQFFSVCKNQSYWISAGRMPV
jgi:hypothetical protein